jgi:hypothetical protein
LEKQLFSCFSNFHLITEYVYILFSYLLVIFNSSFVKDWFASFAHFVAGVFILLIYKFFTPNIATSGWWNGSSSRATA